MTEICTYTREHNLNSLVSNSGEFKLPLICMSMQLIIIVHSKRSQVFLARDKYVNNPTLSLNNCNNYKIKILNTDDIMISIILLQNIIKY